jgi:capsular polysaccharide biosynthesis protein
MMTGAAQGWRRPIVLATLVAVLVGATAWLLAVSQPTEYDARVDLLASPRDAGSATLKQFSVVAGQSMKAVVATAHSPSVLAPAAATVGGGPPPAELSKLVTVDVVPPSLLIRLSVRTTSSAVAREAVVAIAKGVVSADLLAPIGELRLVDAEPTVQKVSPDALLAAGLSMAAGVAAAAVVLLSYALMRRSPRVQAP